MDSAFSLHHLFPPQPVSLPTSLVLLIQTAVRDWPVFLLMEVNIVLRQNVPMGEDNVLGIIFKSVKMDGG